MSEPWVCCGCGVPAPEKRKACECPTRVVYVPGTRLQAWCIEKEEADAIATAYHDGFMDALGRQPWEDASDFAILSGIEYARSGKRSPP